MSYILEGLKKLEEKRQREEKAFHQLTFEDSPRKPEKRSIWPYLLSAVLLLNAIIIFWWIVPRHSSKENTPARPVAVPKNTQTKSIANPVEQKNSGKPLPAKELQQPTIASRPLTTPAVKETKEVPLPAVKETPVSKQPSVVAPVSPTKSKPPADGRILKLNELPSEIKNSLPDLKMSAHFYSTERQARFARVNDRILHEGETLSEGLKIEEINASGTVFHYQGWRFQIGINENR